MSHEGSNSVITGISYPSIKEPQIASNPKMKFSDRLMGFIFLESKVIEEIRTNDRYQTESVALIILSSFISSFFQILASAGDLNFTEAIGIISFEMLFPWIFIMWFDFVVGFMSYGSKRPELNSTIRLLSFLFLINSISEVLAFWEVFTGNPLSTFFNLFWSIYVLLLFFFVSKSSMQTDYITTIFTVVIVFVGIVVLLFIQGFLISLL